MNVKLTRIKAGEVVGVNPLRTTEILGNAESLPMVGERFYMTADPLNPEASVRVVATSNILSVEVHKRGHILTTETGSTYLLEII